MTIFGEIDGGVVVNVAVSDGQPPPTAGTWAAAGTVIPAIGWAAAQAGGVWQFTAPPVPAPTLAQQAATAMAAGLTISLSGSVTLAATLFPTDAATQGKLAAVAAGLGATGQFPGGATTFPMKDCAGAWHSLTQAQYKAVAGAILSYVAASQLIVDGNPLGATALPPDSVALAV